MCALVRTRPCVNMCANLKQERRKIDRKILFLRRCVCYQQQQQHACQSTSCRQHRREKESMFVRMRSVFFVYAMCVILLHAVCVCAFAVQPFSRVRPVNRIHSQFVALSIGNIARAGRTRKLISLKRVHRSTRAAIRTHSHTHMQTCIRHISV